MIEKAKIDCWTCEGTSDGIEKAIMEYVDENVNQAVEAYVKEEGMIFIEARDNKFSIVFDCGLGEGRGIRKISLKELIQDYLFDYGLNGPSDEELIEDLIKAIKGIDLEEKEETQ